MLILIIVIIIFFYLFVMHCVSKMFKTYPFTIEDTDSKIKLRKNDALVLLSNIPMCRNYWNIIPYEYTDNNKTCLSNYVSSGNYVNTDLDDCICIIITSNKILYESIVYKMKASKSGSYLTTFIPVFINENKNNEYGFEYINLKKFTIKKYTIDKISYAKPEKPDIVDIYKFDINNNYAKYREANYISNFEKNARDIVTSEGLKIINRLEVNHEPQELGSDITIYRCNVNKPTKVAIIVIDHAMTKKCNYSDILIDGLEIKPVSNIYDRNLNYDSEISTYLYVENIQTTVQERLFVDSNTRLAPHKNSVVEMIVYEIE